MIRWQGGRRGSRKAFPVLAGLVVLITSLACAVNNYLTKNVPAPTVMQCGQTSSLDFETHLISLINQTRAASKLPELKTVESLSLAARMHSADMACQDYFGSENQAGEGWHELMLEGRYLMRYGSEEVIAGSDSPEAALEELLADESGRNFLFDTTPTDIGVGYAEKEGTKYFSYWTIFLGLPSELQ